MARISLSSIVEEIVGKLAGSVFQDSYGGLQIRTRVTPRNPQTQYQQLRRGEFGYLSGSWRNLTDVQRQSFIDAASTPPAALNLFLQANINLTLIEEPTVTTYVPSSDPGTMTIEFVEASPLAMTVQATGGTTVVPAGTKLLLQVTFLKAPTKIFTNPSMYSPVISFDEGTDLSTPTDILTEWQARYGQLVINKRVCLKSALIDKSNGLRGADSVNCTITEEMAKFVKIHTNISQTTTAGTASTTLDTFNLPANTLAANGDIATCNYGGVSSSGAASGTVNWSFNGTGNGVVTGLGVNTWEISVRIQRVSSTVASYTITAQKFNDTPIQITFLDTAVDWTNPITIEVTAQAPVSGAIIMTQADINKELV